MFKEELWRDLKCFHLWQTSFMLITLVSNVSSVRCVIQTVFMFSMCAHVCFYLFHVCFVLCCRKTSPYEGTQGKKLKCSVFYYLLQKQSPPLVLSSQMMINFCFERTICHLRNLCNFMFEVVLTQRSHTRLLPLISCHGSFAGFCKSLCCCLFIYFIFSFVCEIVYTSDSREKTLYYKVCSL